MKLTPLSYLSPYTSPDRITYTLYDTILTEWLYAIIVVYLMIRYVSIW